MKKIPLTKGKYALVDDWAYEWLRRWKWQYVCGPNNRTGYAQRGTRENGKLRCVLMHRYILDAPWTHLVDHKNGDTLDNRLDNIRLCTASQNAMNADRRKWSSKESTSRYRGVWSKGCKSCQKKRKEKSDRMIMCSNCKWTAEIRANGVRHSIGTFTSELEAAKAYNKKAQELHGEFAVLNILT